MNLMFLGFGVRTAAMLRTMWLTSAGTLALLMLMASMAESMQWCMAASPESSIPLCGGTGCCPSRHSPPDAAKDLVRLSHNRVALCYFVSLLGVSAGLDLHEKTGATCGRCHKLNLFAVSDVLILGKLANQGEQSES
mmetsp:Transcript_11854/g.22963  ORF Transcript_11854/g.22963 Transcript_11854/m.22963 type:complete len:137 (-) Transcript_11854:123-533(-)